MRVNYLGAFLEHVAGEDAMGGVAVSFYCSCRLRMAHFNQGFADGNSLLAVEEDCTRFSHGGGSHDGADILALGENFGPFGVGVGRMEEGGGVSIR